MKRLLMTVVAAATITAAPMMVQADPASDLKAFRDYYFKRFPNVPLEEYANGTYAIDAASREQWESIEEFPPYELAVEEGEELFNTPFKNGKTYASCFRNGGIGVRSDYPRFDSDTGKIVTMEKAINDCRIKNGEEPLPYMKGKLASISAYMS